MSQQRPLLIKNTLSGRFVGMLCLLSAVLMITAAGASAQNKEVYFTSEKTEIIYSYNDNPDKEGKIVNYFLEEIARSIPKQARYTRYVFSYNKVCRITATGNNRYTASVEFTGAQCSGDIIYKDFSISDVLVPPFVDMSVYINGRSVTPLASADLPRAPLNAGYNKMSSLEFSDTAKNFAYTFNLYIKNVFYDDAAKSRFSDMRKLIDDYYQSDFQMEAYNRTLDKFDFGNIDMIIVYDIQLKEVEKAVEQLFSRNFAGKLRLNEKDPISYIEKFSKLSERCIALREKMEVLLSTLDKQYYEKGLSYFESKDYQLAQKFFKRSVAINRFYSPAHYRLARILYMRDSIVEAGSEITDILQQMNPDHNLKRQVLDLADTIYRAFIGHGNYFIVQEKYNEALALFVACRAYCASTPEIVCDNEVSKGLSRSKFGIYRSYLSVAQKAMDNGKLELAQIYIEEARKYQRNNAEEIIGDAECDAYIARLVRAYIITGDQLAGKGNYEKALSYYEKAREYCVSNAEYECPNDLPVAIRNARISLYNDLCRSARALLKDKNYDRGERTILQAAGLQQQHPGDIPSSLNSDTILARVKGYRYRQLIAEGRQLMVYAQMKAAAGVFLEARELEEKFPFRRDYSLDSLLKASGLPMLLDEVGAARALADNGLTDSARVQYHKIAALQHKLMLDEDDRADEAIRQLNTYIQQKKCGTASRNADAAVASANEYISKKDFINADTLLQRALDIIYENQGCDLNGDQVMALHNNYQPGADYQVLMKHATEVLYKKELKLFIDDYEKAEALFNSAKLRNTGISHIPLLDYLSQQKDRALVSSGIQHYLLYSKVNEAFRLLKVLYADGMSADDSRALQESVGMAMARADKKTAPASSPRKTVVFYTGNEKWFIYFKKAYLLEWKNEY